MPNHFEIRKVCKKPRNTTFPRRELLVEIDFFGDAPATETNSGLVDVWYLGGIVADA
jgi:hypothetical protein